jgi:hypothetical protein
MPQPLVLARSGKYELERKREREKERKREREKESRKLTNMKKVITGCVMFMLISVLASAQDKVVINDANAQQRTVGSFKEISVSGSIDLYLSPDEKEIVVVSAKEVSMRDRIVTRVSGDRLEIFFDSKGLRPNWGDLRLKAYVSFRQLSRLKASGSSDIFVNGVIKGDWLSIELSGSSDFSGAVDVSSLKLDQSGSSDSKLSGRAGSTDIDLSGASDVKGFDLQTNTCTAHASGASDISITVNKELTVNLSGASDVRYKGTGVIREMKSSGSSSVKKAD